MTRKKKITVATKLEQIRARANSVTLRYGDSTGQIYDWQGTSGGGIIYYRGAPPTFEEARNYQLQQLVRDVWHLLSLVKADPQ